MKLYEKYVAAIKRIQFVTDDSYLYHPDGTDPYKEGNKDIELDGELEFYNGEKKFKRIVELLAQMPESVTEIELFQDHQIMGVQWETGIPTGDYTDSDTRILRVKAHFKLLKEQTNYSDAKLNEYEWMVETCNNQHGDWSDHASYEALSNQERPMHLQCILNSVQEALKQATSAFNEIRTSHTEDNFIHFDAYKTESGGEEGTVIAIMHKFSGDVYYIQKEYRTDPMLIDAIDQQRAKFSLIKKA